ncbi:putative amidophosphoribosyltransferase [Beggiatoa alba B18LD]|uniref:Putative amidophosphoribosyltransferase n=1 Tax=Beggiatoa alba B18LD TaxID=395493 RepID=I3CHS4_9GAMM|nr:ComF family protein [Beggiatoa alba]EIJ43167.1 putative amidophosphoribosyltransferase [Beggiatoa alba B18LD]
MYQAFLNWFLPQSCFLCGTENEQAICASCLQALARTEQACLRCGAHLTTPHQVCGHCLRHPPPYQRLQAAFAYTYPTTKLIQAAKFHNNLAVLHFLGQWMARCMLLNNPPDVLIPIPLHPQRLRTRGYNQAVELAKQVSFLTKIPYDDVACIRHKNTSPQTRLSAHLRRENLKDAFSVLYTRPQWQRVCLIDDVVTTGSTVKELAHELRRAGIKQVDVWCCAKA